MTPSEAFEVLVTLVKGAEGFEARAYPDPASPLSVALAKRGLLRSYKAYRAEIPEDLRGLSGAPWTIGYGETQGVKEGMHWTEKFADVRLRARLLQFMAGVVARCPILRELEPERLAACTSLAYNIGLGAFGSSSVARYTKRRDFALAEKAFHLWNKAGGKILAGLVARRKVEASLYGLSYGQS